MRPNFSYVLCTPVVLQPETKLYFFTIQGRAFIEFLSSPITYSSYAVATTIFRCWKKKWSDIIRKSLKKTKLLYHYLMLRYLLGVWSWNINDLSFTMNIIGLLISAGNINYLFILSVITPIMNNVIKKRYQETLANAIVGYILPRQRRRPIVVAQFIIFL